MKRVDLFIRDVTQYSFPDQESYGKEDLDEAYMSGYFKLYCFAQISEVDNGLLIHDSKRTKFTLMKSIPQTFNCSTGFKRSKKPKSLSINALTGDCDFYRYSNLRFFNKFYILSQDYEDSRGSHNDSHEE